MLFKITQIQEHSEKTIAAEDDPVDGNFHLTHLSCTLFHSTPANATYRIVQE
jgi:hypothetical protein